LQSADIDFITTKTRSAVASGNGARTGIDQIAGDSYVRIERLAGTENPF
jgi:hypothetical protein